MNAVFVVAEAGVNHNGDLGRALEMIDVAAAVGADAVKFQTFKSEAVISRAAPKADYQISTTGNFESQLDMVRKLELDAAAHKGLAARCNARGIEFMSTPFDSGSADFLVNEMDVSQIKIPSGEITNAPFLLQLARFGRPLLISTGMSSLAEIECALMVVACGFIAPRDEVPTIDAMQNVFRSPEAARVLHEKVTLLHCTTEYPAPVAEVNLRAMDTLATAFGLKVGFSDHTPGINIAVAAVARGACVIEKHFTLDRTLPGPDHKASLEPIEMRAMIQAIRETTAALGDGRKVSSPSETKNIAIARKSLVAGVDIAKGELWTSSNLASKRPGNGRTPFDYWTLLGRPAKRNYCADELIDGDE